MPPKPIPIPEDLLQLKSSDALESVSMSTLARKGTTVLRQITDTAQAVSVKIQGQGAMVTISQRQYDQMVELIGRLREQSSDDFSRMLSQKFDERVGAMNRPGASGAIEDALFGDSKGLRESYRPGETETDE